MCWGGGGVALTDFIATHSMKERNTSWFGDEIVSTRLSAPKRSTPRQLINLTLQATANNHSIVFFVFCLFCFFILCHYFILIEYHVTVVVYRRVVGE